MLARSPRIGSLLLVLSALFAAPAAAQTFPKFTGYVVDAANVMPPAEEAALNQKLAALEKDTARQLVVATIPDLQGYAIEDYGYRLGRSWGVGDAKRDDGAILIVAPAARRVRVEVGYGLTPVLTDALSSVIINQTIVPRFRAGDMPGGIVAGTDALIAQLRLPDPDARQRVAEAGAAKTQRARGSGSIPASLVFWGIVLVFVLLSMLRGGGGRRYRRGGGPVVIWGPGLGGWGGSGGGSSWGGGGGGFGGGFGGGGGGSFGGGGASGSW